MKALAIAATIIALYSSGNMPIVHTNYPEIVPLGEFKLTAYCSCAVCCDEWAYNRPIDENGQAIVKGASGEVLKAGTSIAVDPEVIPYGSTVLINGQAYIAHDCGGAIKGNRIDVYHDNHKEAWNYGLKHAEVYLVKER